MGAVIAKRVLGSFGAILGATILAFIIMRALPGNPARLIVGPLATPQAVASVHREIGLDKPIFTQYWLYISHFFEGNWGYSYADGKSVSALIGERLGATIELALFSFGITMICAVLAALLSGMPLPTGFTHPDSTTATFGLSVAKVAAAERSTEYPSAVPST